MANLPPSLSGGPSLGAPSPPPPPPASSSAANAAAVQAAAGGRDRKMVSAEQLVLDLCDPELRENALLDLSKVTLLPHPLPPSDRRPAAESSAPIPSSAIPLPSP